LNDVVILMIFLQLANVALKTAGYTSIVAVIGAALSAFPESDYRMVCAPYAAFLPLPLLSCLSLFTTLHSQRTVRDQTKVARSFGANLDSFIRPSSWRGDPSHLSPLPTRPVQARPSVQEEEKEDWKPDEARREGLSPRSTASRDSNH
jgi:hypothetical protein